MGHILSVEAAINVGFGLVMPFVSAIAMARSGHSTPFHGPAPLEQEVDTPIKWETPVHDIPPMLRPVSQRIDRPSSSAACTYTSEPSDVDPSIAIEENEKFMVPVTELLLGIGTSFAAEEDHVQSPAQVLEELDEGNAITRIWPAALKKEAAAVQMHNLHEIFGSADNFGHHAK